MQTAGMLLGYSLIPLEDSNSSSWYGAGPRCVLSESRAQWSILVTRVLGQKLWLWQSYKLHSASDSDSSRGQIRASGLNRGRTGLVFRNIHRQAVLEEVTSHPRLLQLLL